MLVILTLLAVAGGVQTARGLFESEELHLVESFVTINPPLIIASEEKAEANPFIPILPEVPKIERPPIDAQNLAAQFDARNLKITLLASETEIAADKVENCKSLIESTLTALPKDLTTSLDEMKLFFAKRSPRGLSNSHLIELQCSELSDDEIVSVLVHELGHIVDLGKLKGDALAPSGFADGKIKIPADDPSVEFYQLSWRNEYEKKYLAERQDFVSGYAMSDAFEDFAESFNFYILHGEDFRAIKTESPILTKKYEFLKNKIFEGVEFTSERKTKDTKRVWDVTLIEFDRDEFFSRG